MSSTEEDRPRQAAAALFEEAVVPLAEANRAAGKSYFATGRDPAATSYYQQPLCRVMTERDFEFPGGGTAEGLVEALGEAWAAQGEAGLAAMKPRLMEIATALRAEAEAGDGSVSVLCYTMF